MGQPAQETVCLLHNNQDFIDKLTEQLRSFGYTLDVFRNESELKHALLQSTKPLAIIADLNFDSILYHGAKLLADLQFELGVLPPILFTSDVCDLQACLQSVRANGSACIKLPDINQQIIERINAIANSHMQTVVRVLLVTRPDSHQSLLQAKMKQRGILVNLVTEPNHLFDAIISSQPDIILMDIYLEGCSGIQLARVIRQELSFVSIPIVFISEQKDFQDEFDPMALGGDEFLVYSANDDYIISAIINRANRAKILNSLMVKDSLTGLLNHSRTIELLDVEKSRVERDKSPLCFAMIDIDFFKKVNDTYGHAIGDMVIKALSRLLTQRLRRTDVIGRYGGEEFAVILPNTKLQEAELLLNELRESFMRITFKSDCQEFHVSFSCGLALYNPANEEALIECADKALYQAKQSGRNQVVTI